MVQYVFGYGSLMNTPYRLKVNPHLQLSFAARIRKEANLSVKFNTMLRMKGRRELVRGAGIDEDRRSKGVVGVLIPVDEETLRSLDQIEHPEYERLVLDTSFIETSIPLTDATVFIYVPRRVELPSEGVSFTYIDLMKDGAMEHQMEKALAASLPDRVIVSLDF